MAIGIVTGMASEAGLFRGMPGVATVSTGGDPDATRRGIEKLIGGGADRLLSFGIAGALDASLAPGDLVLASAVHTVEGDRLPVDQKWLVRIAGHLPSARIADVAGSSAIVTTAEAKAMLHRDTGAACVDQESHWVAEAARTHRLPFLVLRAIADRSTDELPPAALVGLDAAGNARAGAVAASLLHNPGQIGALIRVALATRKALKALLGSRTALTV